MKSELLSNYEFEPEEKENMTDEQLLEIIRQRIEKTIFETKMDLFFSHRHRTGL